MFGILKNKIGSLTEGLRKGLERKRGAEENVAQGPEGVIEDKEEVVEEPAAEEEGVEGFSGEKVEDDLKESEGEEEFNKELRGKGKEKLEGEEEVKFGGLKEKSGRGVRAEVSVKQKLKRAFGVSIRIEEKDVENMLDDFELALLEADVEQGAAMEIVENIRKELVGKKIRASEDVSEVLKDEIKQALENAMEMDEVDLLKKVEEKKPFVILFLGPNGAGKSTTIAKVTNMLQENGKKVVLAAADTFRAASIEQLEKHAERLGARVIKHQYGADPAAVAFDAVKAAESGGADVVLIDSAGRQETNKNLMEELKKINRVAKADMRIYVAESLAGQALIGQVKEFNEALGIDGFVLTKIDADAKGGTAISLINGLHKPVLFLGTGQEYSDIVMFSPSYIIDRVVV